MHKLNQIKTEEAKTHFFLVKKTKSLTKQKNKKFVSLRVENTIGWGIWSAKKKRKKNEQKLCCKNTKRVYWDCKQNKT